MQFSSVTDIKRGKKAYEQHGIFARQNVASQTHEERAGFITEQKHLIYLEKEDLRGLFGDAEWNFLKNF